MDSATSPQAAADPSISLSPVALFLQADIVVQIVMAILVLASVFVWAIAIDRGVRIARLRRQVRALDAAARRPGSTMPNSALATTLVQAGREAAALELPGEEAGERRQRLREAMRLALADVLIPVQSGLPFLATIGAIAPFIGLFGTVWGIMNAFTAIAHSGDTSLPSVAPGIAEALFATAIGLVAAIPAVLIYNRLGTGLGFVRQLAGGAIARLSQTMSLDETSAKRRAHLRAAAAE